VSTFHGGLADGVTLLFHRGPLYLRVVHGPNGFDVLDQLDDAPLADETVHVYRRVGDSRQGHINNRGSRKGPESGWYEFADYEHVDGVDGDQLRDYAAWRSWAAGAP
jgi:hypothetical protein